MDSLLVALPMLMKEAGPVFFSMNTVSSLRSCDDSELARVGPLRLPLIYSTSTDRFEGIEWTHCFNLIAEGISPGVPASRSSSSVVFISSVRNLSQTGSIHWDAIACVEQVDFDIQADLVVHIATHLSRRHLHLGMTTLLLPCEERPAMCNVHEIEHVDRYRAANGSWPLPLAVIEREVGSRIAAKLSPQRPVRPHKYSSGLPKPT